MPREGMSLFTEALWGRDGPPDDIVTRRDWMDIASIRKPEKTWAPETQLSREETQHLARGYKPGAMEDKWFAYMEDNRLYLHRSWTGYGIYELTFAAKQMWGETGFVITSARVEGDRSVYKRGSDSSERERIKELLAHVSSEPMAPIIGHVVQNKPSLQAVLGDITGTFSAEPVDAIVTAANRQLVNKGGVDGAIRRAAGPELAAHCERLDGCEVGRAVITPAFELNAQWIIHTVSPRWKGGGHSEAVLLESCYREALARADEVSAESVAFPALGTGAKGYPAREAAKSALAAINSTTTKVRDIYFVCFDGPVYQAYAAALAG